MRYGIVKVSVPLFIRLNIRSYVVQPTKGNHLFSSQEVRGNTVTDEKRNDKSTLAPSPFKKGNIQIKDVSTSTPDLRRNPTQKLTCPPRAYVGQAHRQHDYTCSIPLVQQPALSTSKNGAKQDYGSRRAPILNDKLIRIELRILEDDLHLEDVFGFMPKEWCNEDGSKEKEGRILKFVQKEFCSVCQESLDVMSKTRVTSFFQRQDKSESMCSDNMKNNLKIKSFEHKTRIGDEYINSWWYCGTLPDLLNCGDAIAVGVSRTQKIAETLFYMHCERLLDAFGKEIYLMPTTQRKHALARRAQGLWAPLPGERVTDTPSRNKLPDPLYCSESSGCSGVKPSPKNVVHVIENPTPASSNLNISGSKSRDRRESILCGPFNEVYPPRIDEVISSQYSTTSSVLDFYACRPRVIKYYRRYRIDLEAATKHTKHVSGNDTYWVCQAEIPGFQGPCGPLKGVGVAARDKDAEIAMCQHIEHVIDYFNVCIYNENAPQAEHRRMAVFFGRSAPKLGDAMSMKYDPPHPFRVIRAPHQSKCNENSPPHLYTENHVDVRRLDGYAERNIKQYLKHIGQLGTLENKSFPLYFWGRFSRHSISIHGHQVEVDRVFHRRILHLPLTGGLQSFFAVGSARNSYDAEVLSFMHACSILHFYGISPSSRWMPTKNQTCSAVSLPAYRRLADGTGVPCDSSANISSDIEKGDDTKNFLTSRNMSRSQSNSESDGSDFQRRATDFSSFNEPQYRMTRDGYIAVKVDRLARERCYHTLHSPELLCLRSKTRVKSWCSRLSYQVPIPQYTIRALRCDAENGKYTMYSIIRCELIFSLPKNLNQFESLKAVGESIVRSHAEYCAFMHMELLIDALGLALYDDEKLQIQHSQTVKSRRRWAISSTRETCFVEQLKKAPRPPPLRLVHRTLHEGRAVPDLTECDRSDIQKCKPIIMTTNIRNLKSILLGEKGQTSMLMNEEFKRYIASIESLGHYLRTKHPDFNVLSLIKGQTSSIGKSNVVLHGWLPSPREEVFTHIHVYGIAPVSHIHLCLLLNAVQVVEAAGVSLSGPQAYSTTLQAESKALDKEPQNIVPIRIVCSFQHEINANCATSTKTEGSKTGVSAPLRLNASGHASVATECLSVNNIPNRFQMEEIGFPQMVERWRSYVEECSNYVFKSRRQENAWRMSSLKPPYCGDYFQDTSLDAAENSDIEEIHARTNLYNFCTRKGYQFPKVEIESTNSFHLASMQLPGYPEYTAFGCDKRIAISKRKAAVHALEILRRIDDEFQWKIYNTIPSHVTVIEENVKLMRCIIDLYVICLDLPFLKTKTSSTQLSFTGTTSKTCTMSLVHGDSKNEIVSQGTHGTLNGACDIAVRKMFSALNEMSLTFQSLVSILESNPQLQPEYIPSVNIALSETAVLLDLIDTISTTENNFDEIDESSDTADDPVSDLFSRGIKSDSWSGVQYIGRVFNAKQTGTILPISQIKERMLTVLQQYSVIIICGTTGCGKTTQIPQYILNNNRSARVLVTQPRRISAISIAERVAFELGESQVGGKVGYMVRFDVRRGASLNFCTTGMLLRLMNNNTKLEGVSHLIIDEVHERDLNTDLLLIFVRRLRIRRPDLRVIIMSATLNAEQFKIYFETAGHSCLETGGAGVGAGVGVKHVPVLQVEGKLYPVKTLFLEDIGLLAKADNFTSPSLITAEKGVPLRAETLLDFRLLLFVLKYSLVHDDIYGRCVLIFLPGISEIRSVSEVIGSVPEFETFVLHSSVASAQQRQCFLPVSQNKVKIILATNIAESAVTLPDVKVVIDFGRSKELIFHRHKGNTSIGQNEYMTSSQLTIRLASQANCVQRKGRAGRTQGGICYRMFSSKDYEAMAPYRKAEIENVSLDSTLLQLLSMRDVRKDPRRFFEEALIPPPPQNVELALKNLRKLDAITAQENLTALGRAMSFFPVRPSVAKALVLGCALCCLDTALTLAALEEVKSIFRGEAEENKVQIDIFMNQTMSDHLAQVNAYNQWAFLSMHEASKVAHFLGESNLCHNSLKSVAKCKKQYYGILQNIGLVPADARLACNNEETAFVDTGKLSTYSLSVGMAKSILCTMHAPRIALYRGSGVGLQATECRTKMEILMRIGPQSSVVPHVSSPYFVYSDEQRTAKHPPTLNCVTSISMWHVLLFGVDLTDFEYRNDLGLCVIDKWLVAHMDESTYNNVIVLKNYIQNVLLQELLCSADENQDEQAKGLINFVYRLINTPIPVQATKIPWKERGTLSIPHNNLTIPNT